MSGYPTNGDLTNLPRYCGFLVHPPAEFLRGKWPSRERDFGLSHNGSKHCVEMFFLDP